MKLSIHPIWFDYNLNYKFQYDFGEYVFIQYGLITTIEFAQDSLFCEWVFIQYGLITTQELAIFKNDLKWVFIQYGLITTMEELRLKSLIEKYSSNMV